MVLPIDIESKTPSEVMPDLLVIQIQIKAVCGWQWPSFLSLQSFGLGTKLLLKAFPLIPKIGQK